ncbi:MAG: ATP-binding protein [Planctomycetes bacterium]|nr:ATP-binding protein [Planctomycetota bacterium]
MSDLARMIRRRNKQASPAGDASVPCSNGLVNTNLPPEAEAARQTAALSLIEPAGRRAVAVFLGRDDYEKVADAYGNTMARLLMGSLPALVKELGGYAVMAEMFNPHCGDPLNPVQTTVEVAGRLYPILTSGHLFLYLPEDRVVVSAERLDPGVNVITVRSGRDSAAFFKMWRAFTRKHNYLRGRAFFADGQIIERKRAYTWDDIVISDEVRRTIETHVEGFLRNREQLRQLGLKARRGLILEGPPGTGKTLLGKVLADTLGASFMWVSPRHIDGPAAFEEILQVARFVTPTVVFLEDLDLFAEDRDVRGGMALGELMNQLDGALDNEDIITIATTNRLEIIEKALRNRPGRFDRVLNIGKMDAPCQHRMLARLLVKAVVSADDIAHLVSVTDGYTGAQIEELANTLYILAVNRHDDASGDGDGKPAVVIDRPLIAAALEEFRVELKARVGFHAA